MKNLLIVFAFLLSLTGYSQEILSDSTYRPTKAERKVLSDVGDGVLNAKGKTGNAQTYVTRAFSSISELQSFTKPRPNVQYRLHEHDKDGYWQVDPKDDSSLTNTGTIIVTANNKRLKRVFSGAIHVKWFGAKGDGVTDDSQAFMKAFNFAKTINGIVMASVGKTYLVDNLVIDGRIGFEAEGVGLYRFGGPAIDTMLGTRGQGSVTLKHVAGSTNPMLTLKAGGITMKGFLLDGNFASGTIMVVHHGFENRIESVRCSFGTGIGLDIQGSCNTFYRDIFVDNCGSDLLPGVKIAPRLSYMLNGEMVKQHTINTLDIYGLTIERCKGVHLEIGREVNAIVSYPEFVRITNLHVESPTDNGATINYQPLVRFGNCREVTLIAPFIYGGPGPLIEHDQTDPGYVNVLGGIKLIGGTVLGTNVDKQYKGQYTHPKVGIKLTRGNFFNIQGTTLDNLGLQYTPQDTLGSAISIASTYGQDVFLPPTYQLKRTSVLVKDNRTNGKPLRYEQEGLYIQDQLFRGHLRSHDQVTTLSSSIAANAGTGAPAPSVQGNDMAGRVFFGSGSTPAAGGYVNVTFSKPYKREPIVILTPGNATTASKQIYVGASNTGFTIYLGVSASASQSVSTHHVKYMVIE